MLAALTGILLSPVFPLRLGHGHGSQSEHRWLAVAGSSRRRTSESRAETDPSRVTRARTRVRTRERRARRAANCDLRSRQPWRLEGAFEVVATDSAIRSPLSGRPCAVWGPRCRWSRARAGAVRQEHEGWVRPIPTGGRCGLSGMLPSSHSALMIAWETPATEDGPSAPARVPGFDGRHHHDKMGALKPRSWLGVSTR